MLPCLLPCRRGVRRCRLKWCLFFLSVGCGFLVEETGAEVAVVTNRTAATVTFQLLESDSPKRTTSIASGDSRPVFFSDRVRIQFGEGLITQGFTLEPGSAYYFHTSATPGQLLLDKIGLGPSDEAKVPRLPWFEKQKPQIGARREGKLRVRIAVDDDEPTHRSIWEPRYRSRVEHASQILRDHCGLELEIDSVVMWDSEDRVRNLTRSFAEFEKEVPRNGVDLVIGFTSQYEVQVGLNHLGGSRGTLYPYVLLTERTPNIREPERLQALVHELGHFLGASHSPELQSVMRPILTKGLDRSAAMRIQFDPVNTLLMGLVGEEIRQRGASNLGEVSWETRSRMAEIYDVLRAALPRDPAASQFRLLTSRATAGRSQEEVRFLLQELDQFAKLEHARAEKRAQESGGEVLPRQGEILTARYVREAAAIAEELPSDDRARNLLLALGIFFDEDGKLSAVPLAGSFVTSVDNATQRQQRSEVLGGPTMRGRHDTLKHFFISAYLTASVGSTGARAAGLAKELMDSNGGSGFSFADIAADRAGIVFAEKILDGNVTLEQLAEEFRVEEFLPEIGDLEEGINAAQLQSRAKVGDQEFERELARIEERIKQLPVYAN